MSALKKQSRTNKFRLSKEEYPISRGSPALTAARKEEIIAACAELYETMSFKEITIKEIAAATTFTRTSIYNYFETKEEIFLALLQKEYELWDEAMDAVMVQKESMTRDELAQTLARLLNVPFAIADATAAKTFASPVHESFRYGSKFPSGAAGRIQNHLWVLPEPCQPNARKVYT